MPIRPTALRNALHAFERRVIYPWAAWRGWRPSSLRSVTLGDLDWTYGYEDEPALKDAARLVAPYTVVSLDRLASLWSQVRHLDRDGVPGALVECGVRLGGASAMMALAHMSSGLPFRQLHLFDSFSEPPKPTERDGPQAEAIYARWTAESLSYGTAQSRNLIESAVGYPKEMLIYHPGWFEQTVPAAARKIGPIALLRLDGDWYESTKVCLEELYPNVSVGGVVVIDDYRSFEGCRIAVDEFAARLPKPFMLHRIDAAGCYWIKWK